MSDMSQPEPLTPVSATPLGRLARAERIVTLTAVALGLVGALYLMVSLLAEHEVCYGMEANHLFCRPVDAGAAGWALLILLYPGVLLIGAAAGAWWQTRAVEPGARSTAFGLLASSVVVLIGIVLPAVATAGFFLAPATIAMSVAGALGTIKFVRDFRAERAAEKRK